jgi:GT2 family glycosyltransferase
MPPESPKLGVVVIGRNEGDRLRRCLRSLLKGDAPLVYVDSGSTDDSVEFALDHGVLVVDLDTSAGFTAARARNAGFERLLTAYPEVEFVQFVDGDCEVGESWLEVAANALTRDSTIGVVCGRRRERFPDRSIYNQLCDIEWDTPIGEALSCGGDALFRVEAFEQAGRFNPDIIGGEEPELCVRIRAGGWRVLRIDEEMTLHDADMTRFSQWWKRAMRSGHASAEMAYRHHRATGAPGVRRTMSNIGWGVVLPGALLVGSLLGARGAALGSVLYPTLALRVYRRSRKRGLNREQALAYAISCTVGKFAEATGALRFAVSKLAGRQTTLIEYKGTTKGRIPSVLGR